MKDAFIEITRIIDPFNGLEQLTYKWDGPKDGIVRMSFQFWDEFCPDYGFDNAIGKIINVGSYRLKCFDVDTPTMIYKLVNADNIFGNIKAFLYRFSRWLDLFYRRLIITAAIWKLAEYHQAQIPSWRDLYVVKWFNK